MKMVLRGGVGIKKKSGVKPDSIYLHGLNP